MSTATASPSSTARDFSPARPPPSSPSMLTPQRRRKPDASRQEEVAGGLGQRIVGGVGEDGEAESLWDRCLLKRGGAGLLSPRQPKARSCFHNCQDLVKNCVLAQVRWDAVVCWYRFSKTLTFLCCLYVCTSRQAGKLHQSV